MRQFTQILVALVLLAGPAIAEDAEEYFEYKISTVDRCDGVIMQKQFLPDDESTGSTAIILPDSGRMLYGAFEHGEVLEFGYIDETATYNEDSSFDWGQWVDRQLQDHGYGPWYAASVSCLIMT